MGVLLSYYRQGTDRTTKNSHNQRNIKRMVICNNLLTYLLIYGIKRKTVMINTGEFNIGIKQDNGIV